MGAPSITPPFSEELQDCNYPGAVSFKQFLPPILATVVIDGFMILKDLEASIFFFSLVCAIYDGVPCFPTQDLNLGINPTMF